MWIVALTLWLPGIFFWLLLSACQVFFAYWFSGAFVLHRGRFCVPASSQFSQISLNIREFSHLSKLDAPAKLVCHGWLAKTEWESHKISVLSTVASLNYEFCAFRWAFHRWHNWYTMFIFARVAVGRGRECAKYMKQIYSAGAVKG